MTAPTLADLVEPLVVELLQPLVTMYEQLATADLPLAVNAAEAARLLSISESHAMSLVNRGVLPSVRMGASVRIPVNALLEWLAANTTRGRTT